MTKRPNIVLLIVDSLRYDRCGFAGHNPRLMPNLMSIASRAKVYHSHFSTGSPTQVAMPAVLASSYPLDHGGYNLGIKDRPVTLAECLKEAGYRTIGVHTTSHTASQFGYGRGFDKYYELVDLQFWFGGLYNKLFIEPVKQWKSGERDEASMVDLIGREYAAALDGALEVIDHMDRIGAPEGWRKRAHVRSTIVAEREIMGADPLACAEKIAALGRHYDLGFGVAGPREDLVRRVQRYERFEKAMSRRMRLVIRRRCSGKASIVNRYLRDALSNAATKEPVFLYVHYFDIHESKFLVPQMSAERLARLPRDLARLASPGPRNSSGGRLYDLSCSYVDQAIGGLLGMLRESGLGENTALFVTADHGVEAGPSRRSERDISQQFYNEYLHVPLLVAGPDVEAEEIDGLVSHLDVAPTILDLAGAPIPTEFRGRSLLSDPAPAPHVMAENTGPGRCDLDSKPIYLSIQDKGLKVMYRAAADDPAEQAVYDLGKDPAEQDDLVETDLHDRRRRAFHALARDRVLAVRPQGTAARHD